MPRTLSWIDRIVPISRTVRGSARSHYDRKDIERLFELQPRAAQQLMAALPTLPVGRARLVERAALSDFLARLNDSDEPAEMFARMRAEGGPTVRRKLRAFSLQDYPASVDSPPRMLTIERGELRVKFQTPEEVVEAMLYLPTVFASDLDGFAERYGPLDKKPGKGKEQSPGGLEAAATFSRIGDHE
jgi:hypothetical protein